MSKPVTAVVIDDTSVMRMTLSAILDYLNVEVIGEADNGRAGVDLVLELEPDLILLDILMPDMNGYLALEEINGRMKDPFVVMMTGVDDPEVKRESRLAGAQDYILKSSPPTEIIERLGKHVAFIAAKRK